jgi:hypothetical protein
MAGYGTDELFDTFLTDNGLTVPESAPDAAVLRQRGSDYIDGLYGPRLSGSPTGGLDQERAWPRTGALAYGAAIPDDTIPLKWVQASYWAAWHEGNNLGSLTVAATQAGAVKRRKVDVLETEFFEGSGNASADATVRISAVEGLVAPFLCDLTVTGPAIYSIG